jgi:hypothetical protein
MTVSFSKWQNDLETAVISVGESIEYEVKQLFADEGFRAKVVEVSVDEFTHSQMM